MDDLRLGNAIRLVRRRRAWTQRQLAGKARTTQSQISLLERGHVESLSLRTLRRVAGALDIRVDLTPRWRARRPGPAPQRGGWISATTSLWLIMSDTTTNRRRSAAHQAMLRGLVPDDARAMRRWLRKPNGTIAAVTFWPTPTGQVTSRGAAA